MMRVCEKCSRHVRDEQQCPFCAHRPRMNRAAMVIAGTLAMGSAGPTWYDRVFGCNQQTVVAPYGTPQPPPDPDAGSVVAPYGAPQPPVDAAPPPPVDAGQRTATPLYGAPALPVDAGKRR